MLYNQISVFLTCLLGLCYSLSHSVNNVLCKVLCIHNSELIYDLSAIIVCF